MIESQILPTRVYCTIYIYTAVFFDILIFLLLIWCGTLCERLSVPAPKMNGPAEQKELSSAVRHWTCALARQFKLLLLDQIGDLPFTCAFCWSLCECVFVCMLGHRITITQASIRDNNNDNNTYRNNFLFLIDFRRYSPTSGYGLQAYTLQRVSSFHSMFSLPRERSREKNENTLSRSVNADCDA